MKKQTAVEWLEQEYLKLELLTKNDFNEAKEMEKQQIKYSYEQGVNAEQYYTETHQTDLPPVKQKTESCLSCGYSITIDTQEPYNINRTPNIGESCESK